MRRCVYQVCWGFGSSAGVVMGYLRLECVRQDVEVEWGCMLICLRLQMGCVLWKGCLGVGMNVDGCVELLGGKQRLFGSGDEVCAFGCCVQVDDYHYSPASTSSLNPPLDVNTLVNCVWRGDGKFRRARIIERRRIGDTDGPESYDYYVHYLDCK